MDISKTRRKDIYTQSTRKPPYTNMPLIKRYWIYQWERLPLIPLIGMGVLVSAAAMKASDVFSWPLLTAGTVLITAYFLQIRFADEPKDYEHDNEFYPARPVQRGVITLTELQRLQNVMIGIFFVTAVALQSVEVLLLAILQQFYSYLTRREFFIREWLRKHFFIYMFSHYFQLVILSWLLVTVLRIPDGQKLTHFGFALLLIGVVELSRKIQEADNDQAKDTYSAVLGKSKATGFFVALVCILAIYTLWIVSLINFISIVPAGLLVVAVVFALYASARYLRHPTKRNTQLLQGSGLLAYLLATSAVIIGV